MKHSINMSYCYYHYRGLHRWVLGYVSEEVFLATVVPSGPSAVYIHLLSASSTVSASPLST